MKEIYDVSALILTYNPNLQKLLMTLKSFLLQKGLLLQIIVSDDGSEENYFTEVERMFEKYNFTKYKLVKNESNVGTVKNLIGGLAVCQGKYVKTLSPGDFINGEYTLFRWMQKMQSEQLVAACADAIYYRTRKDGKQEAVSQKTHPQRKNLVGRKLKVSYLLCDDIFLGAAIMCETKTFRYYLNIISGKVIYAEDNVLRLMVFDDKKVGFFDEEAIIYEIGDGISTQGSVKWARLLRKDWEAADKIIINLPTKDLEFKNKFITIAKMKLENKSNQINKLLRYCMISDIFFYKLKTKFNSRLSSKILPTQWLSRLQS